MGKIREKNIWFTSDEHYGHENIIRFCSRPFTDKLEMTERLIDCHNAVVQDGDVVYHIGDFSFANGETTDAILKRLNGTHHLILGNHDAKLESWYVTRKYFETVELIKNIWVGTQYIVMCHFPMISWHKSGSGGWMLHGHEHGYRVNDFTKKRLDVGVDCNDYRPINFDEIAVKMAKIEVVHGPDTLPFNNGFGEYKCR